MRLFKNLKIKHHEEKQSRENEWKVTIDLSYFWLTHPTKYWPNEFWDKWAKMQVKILYEIQKIIPSTHTYLRFSTFFPKQYTDIIELCQAETLTTKKRGGKILLFLDCQDQNVWEKILFGDSFTPAAKSIFMLENKPSNWQEAITELFNIVEKLNDGHSINEYKNQLSKCHCLCYVLDSDLVIAKVDLPENVLLSILEDVARNEGLELTIERES